MIWFIFNMLSPLLTIRKNQSNAWHQEYFSQRFRSLSNIMMDSFTKIVNWRSLITFTKSSIIDAWLSAKCASQILFNTSLLMKSRSIRKTNDSRERWGVLLCYRYLLEINYLQNQSHKQPDPIFHESSNTGICF